MLRCRYLIDLFTTCITNPYECLAVLISFLDPKESSSALKTFSQVYKYNQLFTTYVSCRRQSLQNGKQAFDEVCQAACASFRPRQVNSSFLTTTLLPGAPLLLLCETLPAAHKLQRLLWHQITEGVGGDKD